MKLQINVPNDALSGSKWMIFRRSGKTSFATLIDGVLYNGDKIYEDDYISEVDVENNYEGDCDAVMYYALIVGHTEAPSVGSDLKCGVSIDHEALSAVLYNLERIDATARVMSENKTIEHRRRAVAEINYYIGAIKEAILE